MTKTSKQNTPQRQIHTIDPVFDENSQVLILGSFPSVKSREGNFFYHHPQNRFWRLLALVLNTQPPATIAEKRSLLLSHHIALWDVIAGCNITGSDDSSIRNVQPNDLNRILQAAPIRKIYLNGGKAYALYKKYLQEDIALPAEKLPSTSPANARYSIEMLRASWQQIAEELQKQP